MKVITENVADDWRDSWRFASVQLNAALSFLSSVLISFSDQAEILLAFVPFLAAGPIRTAVLVALLFCILFGPSWLGRIYKQKPIDEPLNLTDDDLVQPAGQNIAEGAKS